MRTLYDAVSPANIPANAQMVAGYVDGHYVWTQADWNRFPTAVKVRIAVFPSTNDGHVLDVEAGDATPDQAPGWVTMRRTAGIDPSVYCSLSAWPAVKQAFQAHGVAEPHYWIAAYPGNGNNLYPGAVAHQYEDYQNLYDLSVVEDVWPGVDVNTPPPTPSPVPHPAPHPAPAPHPVGPPFPGRLIRLTSPMMHGADVKTWQAQMLRRGWRSIGSADGIYGPKSQSICKQFQAEKRLTSDGIIGPNTWLATWKDAVT